MSGVKKFKKVVLEERKLAGSRAHSKKRVQFDDSDDDDSDDEPQEILASGKRRAPPFNKKINEESEENEDDEDEEEDEYLSEEEDEFEEETAEEKEDDSAKPIDQAEILKETIKNELNQMTFEEIQKLQNKLGLKKFKEYMEQKESASSRNKTFTRLNKNRPREISSKKPVSVFRNVFQVAKREVIDPRFSSAFGEYRPEVFRKQYGFVHDLRLKEKDELSQQLKNENDREKKEQLRSALTRLKQQIKSYDESEKKKALDEKFKKTAMQDAKEGKKPHFVNKTEKKIFELAEKYKELKKSGKVENYLAKQRKKQLSKDSKHLNKSEHTRFV